MAKKNSEVKIQSSLFDALKKLDSDIETLENAAGAEIPDWISTGNYILNAAISGSIFKGMPSNRTMLLAGDSGTGKSYLAMSFCREAQKKGYLTIYLDSEGAIDRSFAERLGVDVSKLLWVPVDTIEKTKTFIATMIKELEEQNPETRDNVFIVLDSIGNLSSTKEKEDTLSGAGARDMTKQQALKALFRVCQSDLSRLGVGFVTIAHTYDAIGSYVQEKKVAGGNGAIYNASSILMLSQKKLDGIDKNMDKDADAKKTTSTVKSGIWVTATMKKSRFTIPQKVGFAIPFYSKPNPYLGLQDYLNWENSGICRGNVISQKDYDKMTPAAQARVHVFTHTNPETGDIETLYAEEKDTARNIVVKHLGCHIPLNELWTPKVFTDEFLYYIDENIIRPAFELPSQEQYLVDEIADIINNDNESEQLEDTVTTPEV